MIADQTFMTYFYVFYPTASDTVYGRRPKFVRAEHSATAEGENCAYGPTLEKHDKIAVKKPIKTYLSITLDSGINVPP